MICAFDIKHKKTALFTAGVVSSFGFAPVYAWPLFVVGMLFAFLLTDGAKNLRQAVLTGYVFGFGFFCAGFYWIANALLVDVATFGWLYPIALSVTGVFFGLFFIPSFAIWYCFRKSGVWCQVLVFSSVFVLGEYFRSFFLTGFPWNMVGSMFAFSDVLTQTASLVGTYGLSFLLLLMTGACYAAFKKHYKSALFVVLSILGMMIVFGVWRLKSNGIDYSSIKIRIVQPSIAQSLKWDRQSLDDNLKTYIDMSRNTGMQDVKMIVWGETATAFNPEESIYYKNLIKQAIPENGYLITGLIRYDEKTDKLYNSVSVIDQKGQTVSFYDKNHLVPFGEYIPFRKYLPAWVRPIANHIADFSKGEKFKILHVDGLPPFGALVCYEVIFPDQIVNRNNKPQFIVLVSNDGWYGQSFGPYQHFVAAKLRAVEEGVTIIRSANNGMSGLIDPLGRVFGKINLNVKGVRDVYLPAVLSVFSLYSLIGGIGVQCVMLLILLMMLYQNKHKINQ